MVIHALDACPCGKLEKGWSLSFIYISMVFKMICQYVDLFVYEMAQQETDLTKRRKLDRLLLSDVEWTKVGLFLNLLGVRIFFSMVCY
jgi:hypothetical protein